MKPQIQSFNQKGFIQSFDQTSIHYKTSGKGIPLVFCNGIGATNLFWKHLENTLHTNYQVIIWDYRGHNQSGLPETLEHASVQALIQDCEKVLNFLNVDAAIFLGFSIGTQVALEFFKQHPKRVLGLILCLGTYGKPLDTFYNSPLSKSIYEWITILRTLFPDSSKKIGRFLLKNPFWYELGGLLRMVNTQLAKKEDLITYVDHLLERDPAFFMQILRSFQEHTTEDILKKIQVPTLIVGAEHDRFTPLWLAKKMHWSIPKSEFFIVKQSTHAALLEQPDVIGLRIEKFLRDYF